MKKFIKENWFNLGILVIATLTLASYSFYLTEKNNLEEKKFFSQTLENQQKQLNEVLVQEQKSTEEGAVNECIKDAYTELKTLQSNFDVNTNMFCIKNIEFCSEWRAGNDKSKADAFTRYKEEWVPQCKLGNRVFIHYEPI